MSERVGCFLGRIYYGKVMSGVIIIGCHAAFLGAGSLHLPDRKGSNMSRCRSWKLLATSLKGERALHTHNDYRRRNAYRNLDVDRKYSKRQMHVPDLLVLP